MLAAIGNYPLCPRQYGQKTARSVHALITPAFADCIIVALVTWVIVRNIGGDVWFPRRINMQADARFAIKDRFTLHHHHWRCRLLYRRVRAGMTRAVAEGRSPFDCRIVPACRDIRRLVGFDDAFAERRSHR